MPRKFVLSAVALVVTLTAGFLFTDPLDALTNPDACVKALAHSAELRDFYDAADDQALTSAETIERDRDLALAAKAEATCSAPVTTTTTAPTTTTTAAPTTSTTAPPATGAKMLWRPPFDPAAPPAGTQVSTVPASGGTYTGSAGRRLLLRMPVEVRGRVTVRDWDEVVIIGGRMVAGSAGQQRVLVFENNGKVHVEGLWIDATGGQNWQADAIIANSRRAGSSITVQNVYVHDVNGQAGSQEGDPEHGDVLQTWAGPSILRVAYLSANTRYQGLYLQPSQSTEPPYGTWELRHIDIRRPTAAGWHLFHLDGSPSPALQTEDLWAHAPLEPNQSGDVVSDNFDARVTIGQPPERMVDPDDVGLSYVTPGYL